MNNDGEVGNGFQYQQTSMFGPASVEILLKNCSYKKINSLKRIMLFLYSKNAFYLFENFEFCVFRLLSQSPGLLQSLYHFKHSRVFL